MYSGLDVEAFSGVKQDTAPYIMTNSTQGRESKVNYRPSTTILLTRENAYHNAASLLESLMVQLSLLDILGKLTNHSGFYKTLNKNNNNATNIV